MQGRVLLTGADHKRGSLKRPSGIAYGGALVFAKEAISYAFKVLNRLE